MIFLIVGHSGSGKSTIVERLEKLGYTSVQSYTERPPRYKGEKGHTFISPAEFDKLTNICAYTLYNGYRYCATSDQVDENDLYIVDPYGVDYFFEHYNGNQTAKIIYITAPRELRKERMLSRGDTLGKTEERLTLDDTAFAHRTHDGLIINNIDLDTSMNTILEFIKQCKETENV